MLRNDNAPAVRMLSRPAQSERDRLDPGQSRREVG